ncbi:hypothetical protein D7X55_19305 [Corallococcus sp. AB049A]|uniref:Uncharacterized protein n=1 Tax=Corallococcus interemptor TaxID=2316720 RepID=A0A3A8REZ9_9BACT|nr:MULTISPECIES: hypothetical protein [Corallococcus]RKH74044.1 hypothetical protein D7X96_00310 [Corallococcus interemptor]RKI63776.1 hypothetical protein D7X55_19305 [Corallococcus sp. AB049A]
MSTWEEELKKYFPGYLLPSAGHHALTREAASRFLDRITGKSDTLKLLLAASALAPVAKEVREFSRELPAVARVLPSRTEMEQVDSAGQIRGRLDVPGTFRKNLAGGPPRIVSRIRTRDFDLPENALLVDVARRLTQVLARLEDSGAFAKDTKRGWAQGFRGSSDRIRHTLDSSLLREVSPQSIEARHEQAARTALHPAYKLALRLHESMKDIESSASVDLHGLVAAGALLPLEESVRFELAVLIRLGREIEAALGPENLTVSRALIEKDRSHVFEFSANGNSLRIHYNHAIFNELGARDRGIQHYFGEQGRFRPDITLELLRAGQRVRAVIVEVKYSDKMDYLKQGYQQALLYRAEYAKDLSGWPKAILVVSSEGAIVGAPRREDDVVAVGWSQWVPRAVLEGLIDGFANPNP